jgi:DNA-binding LacI/PurR family transcriptional regulator
LFSASQPGQAAEWREKMSEANVVFLADFFNGPAELWEKMLRGKTVFSMLETVSAPNSIYLDNDAVGRAAAQTLIEAGCRKIAGICFDYKFFNNLIFSRRMNGFRKTLEENHRYDPDLIKLIPYPSNGRFNPSVGDKYSKAAREALEEAYRQGCDGAFVASDEEIGLIAMNLFRRHVIPERMKLLTVNGVGDAMRNSPPIACLSHGTRKTVEAAIEQLKLIAEKRFAGPVNIMIPPNLYSNSTLNDVFFPDAQPEPVSAVTIGYGF